MTKDTYFKFGTFAPRQSPVTTPKIFWEKVGWPGSRDPLGFWALNANISKMTKLKIQTSNLAWILPVKVLT